MAYETITVETDDHIALVKLNRPDAMNALNEVLLSELGQALKAAQKIMMAMATQSVTSSCKKWLIDFRQCCVLKISFVALAEMSLSWLPTIS